MSTKNLTAWFLFLGPLSVFAANFLTSILIGQGETAADRIAEMTDQQALTGVFTFLLVWVSSLPLLELFFCLIQCRKLIKQVVL